MLDGWLHAVMTPEYATLKSRICWAFRRAVPVSKVSSIVLVRQLKLQEAMPCAPWFLPDPALSETVQKEILERLKSPDRDTPRDLNRLGKLLAFAGGKPSMWRCR